jgi:hypothetical protein
MGEIAKAWDQMSDEQKTDELREPTITRIRVGEARGKSDLLESFDNLVTSIRRKAMNLNTLEERAALVDRTWCNLQRRFRRAGIPHGFVAVFRRCLVSETISWPWFGNRIDYPPGEGE